MEIFSKRLKELRKERKLTTLELAEKTGISKSSINSWERAEYQPTLDNIKTLCKFFNVSADYFLGFRDYY